MRDGGRRGPAGFNIRVGIVFWVFAGGIDFWVGFFPGVDEIDGEVYHVIDGFLAELFGGVFGVGEGPDAVGGDLMAGAAFLGVGGDAEETIPDMGQIGIFFGEFSELFHLRGEGYLGFFGAVHFDQVGS